jgi:hypothetical protein
MQVWTWMRMQRNGYRCTKRRMDCKTSILLYLLWKINLEIMTMQQHCLSYWSCIKRSPWKHTSPLLKTCSTRFTCIIVTLASYFL